MGYFRIPAGFSWLRCVSAVIYRRAEVAMRIGRFHGRRRIQHWAFNQLYRHDRWLYDPLAHIVFSGEWDRWRRVALPFVNGSPVLDLGCGTRALLPTLAGEGRFAVGLERSPSMLAAARKRLGPADRTHSRRRARSPVRRSFLRIGGRDLPSPVLYPRRPDAR